MHGSEAPEKLATPEKAVWGGEVGEVGCREKEEAGEEEEDVFECFRVQSQGLKVASFLLHNQSPEDVTLVPISSLEVVVQIHEPPDLLKILGKRLQLAREAAAEAAKAIYIYIYIYVYIMCVCCVCVCMYYICTCIYTNIHIYIHM